MVFLTLDQVSQWLGQGNGPSRAISGFQQDSRLIKQGDLFFAIQGEQADGHDFLKDVAFKGALGAVVSKEYQGEDFGLGLIRVKNVIQALQLLATNFFSLKNTQVIAVTGSVGKTTTKEFIATLLSQKFKIAKTPGSINSQVGLPLFILNMQERVDWYVLEMGMSARCEIERLISIAPPDIAIVTKIALAHAAFFADGEEGIAQAKAEILSHPKTKIGIVSEQAFQFDPIRNSGSCAKVTYGFESDGVECPYLLKKVDGGIQIIERGDPSPVFSLPFQASHLYENFLAAAIVARRLGLSWQEIIERSADLKMSPNRFETIERKGITFLNDSYNANVASMRAALMNLPETRNRGKIIAVLGEMRELGSFSERCHREVGEIAVAYVDELLCLGKECQPMVDLFQIAKKPAQLFLDLEAVTAQLLNSVKSGDLVLLKGSNGNQLWKILDRFPNTSSSGF